MNLSAYLYESYLFTVKRKLIPEPIIYFSQGKLKFKIKDHRISIKTEISMPKLKAFRKKNLEHFWSKFAPPEFRFIEYHRVSLLVMTILCLT
jgi:hypothetical protein